MAVLNKNRIILNDMEHANNLYLEKSLVSIEKRHLSSVQITEYPDSGLANPEPDSDSQEDALEDFLSPQFLKNLTGTNNLSEVAYLKMEVDTSETSIGNLGQLLPNLRQLKLSNSVINSIRDLGTCLNDLTTLWLQRCGLIDLDGISCFNSLKELYLAYNEIDDLSSLSMLDNLSCLDLEGNNIDDIAQVEFLGLCSSLISLSLSGNPVELAPHPDTSEKDLKFYDYRSAVSKAVPNLRILDDEPFLFDVINGRSVIRSTSSCRQQNQQALQEDIFMVQDSIKALCVIEEDEDDEEGSNGKTSDSGSSQERSRPSSGRSRPVSGRNRPLSSRNRPLSSRNRPLSSRNRPLSSRDRPSSSLTHKNRSSATHDQVTTSHASDSPLRRPESVRSGFVNGIAETQNNFDEDDSSDLTHGSKQVICGNPVRALLARRKELKGDIKLKFDRNSPEVPSNQFVPEHSYYLDDDSEDVDRNIIFEELKRWRDNFEKSSRELLSSESTVTDVAVKEKRSTLSPTPPSGNPSRPSRRKLPNHSEIQRPQTASDFRPLITANILESKARKTQVVSKSVDVTEHRKMRDEDTEIAVNRTTPTIEIPVVTNESEQRIPKEPQRQYYRPGTAAAAYKKRSQKHFT